MEDENQQQPEPPAFVYVPPPPPPNQRCEAEGMITIESVSLRKGGWRNTDGFLSDLRHLDPKIGVLIFYAFLTALLFFIFFRLYGKNFILASMYTVPSICILAVLFSSVGIDLFSAVGGVVLR